MLARTLPILRRSPPLPLERSAPTRPLRSQPEIPSRPAPFLESFAGLRDSMLRTRRLVIDAKRRLASSQNGHAARSWQRGAGEFYDALEKNLAAEGAILEISGAIATQSGRALSLRRELTTDQIYRALSKGERRLAFYTHRFDIPLTALNRHGGTALADSYLGLVAEFLSEEFAREIERVGYGVITSRGGSFYATWVQNPQEREVMSRRSMEGVLDRLRERVAAWTDRLPVSALALRSVNLAPHLGQSVLATLTLSNHAARSIRNERFSVHEHLRPLVTDLLRGERPSAELLRRLGFRIEDFTLEGAPSPAMPDLDARGQDIRLGRSLTFARSCLDSLRTLATQLSPLGNGPTHPSSISTESRIQLLDTVLQDLYRAQDTLLLSCNADPRHPKLLNYGLLPLQIADLAKRSRRASSATVWVWDVDHLRDFMVAHPPTAEDADFFRILAPFQSLTPSALVARKGGDELVGITPTGQRRPEALDAKLRRALARSVPEQFPITDKFSVNGEELRLPVFRPRNARDATPGPYLDLSDLERVRVHGKIGITAVAYPNVPWETASDPIALETLVQRGLGRISTMKKDGLRGRTEVVGL